MGFACLQKMQKLIVFTKWETNANIKTRISSTGVISALCLIEYERCHLLGSSGTWKDHQCTFLIPVTCQEMNHYIKKCHALINGKSVILQHYKARTHSLPRYPQIYEYVSMEDSSISSIITRFSTYRFMKCSSNFDC